VKIRGGLRFRGLRIAAGSVTAQERAVVAEPAAGILYRRN